LEIVSLLWETIAWETAPLLWETIALETAPLLRETIALEIVSLLRETTVPLEVISTTWEVVAGKTIVLEVVAWNAAIAVAWNCTRVCLEMLQ